MSLQNYKIHIDRVDQIVWTTGVFKKPPNLYVEVRVDESVQHTRVVKRNIRPTWNEDFPLLTKGSSTLSLLIKHHTSNLLATHACVGAVTIELSTLLGLCKNNQHSTLPLKPMNANANDASGGFIVVQLTAVTLIQAGQTAIDNAGKDIERGEIMNSAAAADTAPTQDFDMGNSAFLMALQSVVSQLDVFVQIVDTASKVHPYVNLAWQVISSLYNVVKGQFERDKKLVCLTGVMADVYSFVDAIRTVPGKVQLLEDIIAKILKQTVECAIFIREYTGHGFGSRIAKQTFADTDRAMDDLSAKLVALKQSFDSDVNLQTVFISTRTLKTVERLAENDNLKELNAVRMDAFSRSECLPNTRQYILKFITDWLTTPSGNENIIWLHAMAGFGKSTISTTIAEYFRELERLGAFIFFNKNTTSSDPAVVIRTLSYQLARFDPFIKAAVCTEIEHNPGITEAAMRVQFAKLIVEPLASLTALNTQGPVIVALDALDECGDPASRKSLLTLLAQESTKLPSNFRFVITSRREPDIEAAFSGRSNIVAVDLHAMDQSKTADVSLYIRHHIAALPRDGLASDWPGEESIQALISHSEGLFIWASTAIKFIEEGYNPEQQLDLLLSSQSRELARSALDTLYDIALGAAAQWNNNAAAEDFRAVLGALAIGKTPLSDITLDQLLGLDGRRSSRYILKHLRCLLQWNPGQPVQILHASFADYLTNQDRCGSRPWFADLSIHHRIFALACFRHMEAGLRFNICDLETSHVFNDSVHDLDVRIKNRIPDHLSYACRFWADHLVQTNYDHNVLPYLKRFFHVRLLQWLEVLSLIKQITIASRALKSIATWAKSHDDVTVFATDAMHFVSSFRQAISQSTPHIYLSAMAFLPVKSIISETYLPQFPRLLSIEIGRVLKWSILLHVLEGHMDEVKSVAFSPDGSRIVSGAYDGTIGVWNVETGEAILPPSQKHKDAVWSVAFSPDGRHIVSSSEDMTIRVWSAETGEAVLAPLSGHTSDVGSVAFSPDGKHIVSGSDDMTIQLWDAKTGKAGMAPLKGHEGAVHSVAFSPDGNYIVSGSMDKTVRVWNTKTGDMALSPFEGHEECIQSVAFSPDGHYIVSGSEDKTIRLWNAKTGEPVVAPFKGHTDEVWSVAFSPDGKRIVSGSRDETIRVWSAETGEAVLAPFRHHTEPIDTVTFSPDGRFIVSGSDDYTILIWNAEIEYVLPMTSEGHIAWVRSVAFSADSRRIVSCSEDQTIRVWDAETGKLIHNLTDRHHDWILSVAFSPDGKRIVSGSQDETVQVSCAETGSPLLPPLKGHTDAVTSVAFSPNGTIIASGSEDHTVRVWNAETGAPASIPFKGHTDVVLSVVFSPDGQRIVSGSGDKSIRVWNSETGEEMLLPLNGHTDSVNSVAISPNGKQIASGSDDLTIRVWNAETGVMLSGPFKGHEADIYSVAFSPNGERIISGSTDSTIRVWNTESGEEIIGPFRGHMHDVASVAFSFDGRWMISGSGDQTVRVWGTEMCEMVPERPAGHSSVIDATAFGPDDKFSADHFKRRKEEAATAGFFDDSKLVDGWMLGKNSELLFWVPPSNRMGLWRPSNTAVMGRQVTRLNFETFVHGTSWIQCRNSQD